MDKYNLILLELLKFVGVTGVIVAKDNLIGLCFFIVLISCIWLKEVLKKNGINKE